METQKSRIQKSDEFCQQEQEIQQQKFINNIRKLLNAEDTETREIGVQLLLSNRNLIVSVIDNERYKPAITIKKSVIIDNERTLILGECLIVIADTRTGSKLQYLII